MGRVKYVGTDPQFTVNREYPIIALDGSGAFLVATDAGLPVSFTNINSSSWQIVELLSNTKVV